MIALLLLSTMSFCQPCQEAGSQWQHSLGLHRLPTELAPSRRLRTLLAPLYHGYKLTSESPCNTDSLGGKWPQATLKHNWIPASPNITSTKPASPKTTQSKSQTHLKLHQETAHLLHDYTSSQPALRLHQDTESTSSTIISATEPVLYSITDVKGALSLTTKRGKAGHGFSAKQTWGQHPPQAVSSESSSPLGEEAELQVLYVPWELNVNETPEQN